MSFLDTRFPINISYGSTGGPEYSTSVIELYSGLEQRNLRWTYPRHIYDAASGVTKMTDLEDLIAMFHIAQGRANSFRWKDWSDYKSSALDTAPAATNQALGTGDGVEDEFQIIKTYTVGAYSKTRKITHPVSGTVLVAVNTVVTTAFTVNLTTGIITFTAPPVLGAVLTCGYEFDVPCRFDTDKLSTSLDDYRLGSIAVPIVEVKVE